MSADVIFNRSPDGEFTAMVTESYDSEDVLQRLLAECPELLAGGEKGTGSRQRWQLVRREMGVPDHPQGGARWSIDHLFVDQDAVPTLVEVKRASDTRIRREVVGQMLDYAANGLQFWPVDVVRSELETTCGGPREMIDSLADLLEQEDPDVDAFFQQVAANLTSGRVRLVFVADQIPDELARIIEFLNAQLRLAEVMGIEVRQYAGEDQQVLVPRLIGFTPAAALAKGRVAGPFLDLDQLFCDVDADTRQLRECLEAWASQHGAAVASTGRSMRLALGSRTACSLYPGKGSGRVELGLGQLRARGLSGDADALLQRLRDVAPELRLGPNYPGIPAGVAVERWAEVAAVLSDLARILASAGE